MSSEPKRAAGSPLPASIDRAAAARDARESRVVDRSTRTSVDAEVVNMVRLAGRDSSEFRYLKEALAEVAVGSLVVLHRDGKLFPHLRRLGLRVQLPPPPSFKEDSRALIHLTVSSALGRFMEHQILGGGWDPSAGASLRTYFVNACLFRFADEYRKYCREESAGPLTGNTLLELESQAHQLDLYRAAPNPEEVAVNKDEIVRLTQRMTQKQKSAIFLVARGWTQQEIAEEIGISPEAVSTLVRRARLLVRNIRNDDCK